VTFLQVLCRFVIHVPVVWSEELVRMSFVWMIFLGAAIALKEGAHLTLDMLVSTLNVKGQYVMRMVVLIIIFIAAGFMCYAGFSYVIRNIGKTAVTMPIPSNCVYISAPISALLMMFFSAEQFIGQIKEGFRKGGIRQ
jgi:TRAP-type C4-dicarboxylate transport system permease small subunit